jgi:hypothetical protein
MPNSGVKRLKQTKLDVAMQDCLLCCVSIIKNCGTNTRYGISLVIILWSHRAICAEFCSQIIQQLCQLRNLYSIKRYNTVVMFCGLEMTGQEVAFT